LPHDKRGRVMGRDSGKSERAREFIRTMLDRGPALATEVRAAAKRKGIDAHALHQACRTLNVISVREHGRARWSKPRAGWRTVLRAGMAYRRAHGSITERGASMTKGPKPKARLMREAPPTEFFVIIAADGAQLARVDRFEDALSKGRALIASGAVAVLGAPHATVMARLARGLTVAADAVVARAVAGWRAAYVITPPAQDPRIVAAVESSLKSSGAGARRRVVRERVDAGANSPGGRAAAWLRALLADGPRHASEIVERARKAHIAHSTLFRARDALGIEAPRGRSGPREARVWSLPSSSAAQHAAE